MTLGVSSGDMTDCCLVRTRIEMLRMSSSPPKVHQECGDTQGPVITALGAGIVRSPDSILLVLRSEALNKALG